jgi:D-tyrosyl-tRNA(Tyr) deacylase
MRAVLQRVSQASVRVAAEPVGEIKAGLLVLACAMAGDTLADAEYIAHKVRTLRIFHDEQGKMNRSISEIRGAVLLISQFTLAADTASGTRPSFSTAMPPGDAEQMIAELAAMLKHDGLTLATGEFGALMEVELTNQGPVTIYIDSRAKKRK